MAKILKEIYLKKEQSRLFNIRVTKTDMEKMKEKAEKYTGGNITALIKIACRDFNPKKSDLIKIS